MGQEGAVGASVNVRRTSVATDQGHSHPSVTHMAIRGKRAASANVSDRSAKESRLQSVASISHHNLVIPVSQVRVVASGAAQQQPRRAKCLKCHIVYHLAAGADSSKPVVCCRCNGVMSMIMVTQPPPPALRPDLRLLAGTAGSTAFPGYSAEPGALPVETVNTQAQELPGSQSPLIDSVTNPTSALVPVTSTALSLTASTAQLNARTLSMNGNIAPCDPRIQRRNDATQVVAVQGDMVNLLNSHCEPKPVRKKVENVDLSEHFIVC